MHSPEKSRALFGADNEGNIPDSVADSESDSGSDDDDGENDSEDGLAGFIVPDDVGDDDEPQHHGRTQGEASAHRRKSKKEQSTRTTGTRSTKMTLAQLKKDRKSVV